MTSSMNPSYRTMNVAVLFLTIYHSSISVGQTAFDALALREELFVTNGYNKRVRPTIDHTFPTEVALDLHLLAINEVNTVDETMRLTAFLDIKWTDEFLTWDPEDHGGLEFYHWPQDDVWKPVIALRNSYLDYKALGDQSLDILNDSPGAMNWMPFQVFTSTCSMNVRNYPFDVQTCDMKFGAWGYTQEEVQLLAGNEGIVLDEYEPNFQWDLMSSTWKVVNSEVDVTIIFTLKLKRVPGYTIFTVLIPILFLTVLNIFVFILPCESGERVGYAVTVFLSFAVFFTLISGVLPESVALFTIYVIAMTGQSALICLIAIVEVKISFISEDEMPVPRWLVFVAKAGRCECFRSIKCNKCNKKVRATKPMQITMIQDKETNETMGEDYEDGNKDNKTLLGEKETWKNTVVGIDNLLTFLFSLFSLLVTTITIVVCASS